MLYTETSPMNIFLSALTCYLTSFVKVFYQTTTPRTNIDEVVTDTSSNENIGLVVHTFWR
jgi:hypothetical protein